jgi:hypothetical protein
VAAATRELAPPVELPCVDEESVSLDDPFATGDEPDDAEDADEFDDADEDDEDPDDEEEPDADEFESAEDATDADADEFDEAAGSDDPTAARTIRTIILLSNVNAWTAPTSTIIRMYLCNIFVHTIS